MKSCKLSAGKSLRAIRICAWSATKATGVKSVLGVERRLLVEQLIENERPETAEHELIAVGRRPRHAAGAGHAAGATHVLDHDLLAEDLAHARRHHPTNQVG